MYKTNPFISMHGMAYRCIWLKDSDEDAHRHKMPRCNFLIVLSAAEYLPERYEPKV